MSWRAAHQTPETWDQTTEIAIDGQGEGVVALGLAGPEYVCSTASFAPWFQRARAAGLHSTPHAGEFAGPPSVWEAVNSLESRTNWSWRACNRGC
ncbi:MAG: hypothetical protein ACR2JC_09035 [Chloroflexota bacterium]|nr:MAG: hypothetical protein DLM70_09885 [Chloroflexota bacterium]